jgi:phosphoglycerol transferase MdoB-like AlkP superfamily enzyme
MVEGWRARDPRSHVLLFGWIAFVAIGAVLRITLLRTADVSAGFASCARVLARGFIEDGLTAVIVLAPLAVLLALAGDRLLARRGFRVLVMSAFASALIFSCFVEYFFFQEFDSRFNHIAVDYVLYPHEVAGNIWESYPVPLYLAISLALGSATAILVSRAWAPAAPAGTGRWRRLGLASAATGAAWAAWFALASLPAGSSADRRLDEISANGSAQLVRAYATARLPYEAYYRTLPRDRAHAIAARELNWPDPESPIHDFPAVERRERPLDVVVILEESLGSEFVGRLGGKRACTSGLDRWSNEGLLLTNLMATGNRTVRGLESVLCSFVPLPGDSIWKRDKSDEVASIARVLKEHSYKNRFFYGGAGAFDGMRSFALRNGWDEFVEDGLFDSAYPKDAFRTVWGVADEHIFDAVLESQKHSVQAGERYCATVLSVSNHKPFLTPDSPVRGLSAERLRGRIGWAAALLLVSALAWRFLNHRVGAVRLGSMLAIVWAAFVLQAWVDARPRDSRESAVRYSDRALAEYLDKARAAGLMEHTVYLVVGDHGARVYGAEQIPAESYRIPALFLAPEARYHGATFDELCSQIDLAPTLLSLAGIDHASPFFGEDLLALPPGRPGRAYLIHNRDIGLLTDTELVVLGLRRGVTRYGRADRSSDVFVLEREANRAYEDCMTDRAAAVFQVAAELYEDRRYRLGHAP